MTCVLCKANDEERFLYVDQHVKVLSTANLKGHSNRIMVITQKHVAQVSPWLESYMLAALEKIGRSVFVNQAKFVIMSPALGTVPDHAHYIATDLNYRADDFEQILKTPWLRVVDV